MRTTLAFLALTLVACGPGYTPQMPLGDHSVPVAIVDCLDPQKGWVSEEVTSFGWGVAEPAEVTIRCTDTGPAGGAGEHELGTSEVLLDPVKAPGEFAAKAIAGHELTHWRLHGGPHPETARLHICWFARNEPAPAGCHKTIVAQNALMSPSLGGAAVWNVNREVLMATGTPEYRVTDADQQLVDESLRP